MAPPPFHASLHPALAAALLSLTFGPSLVGAGLPAPAPVATPAALLASLPESLPDSARPGVALALAHQAESVAAARQLAAAPSLELLLHSAVQQGGDRFAPAPLPPVTAFPSLEAALAALGAASGRPLSPQESAHVAAASGSLPPALQDAIAGLAAHMVVGLQLHRQALAAVPPADLAFLQELVRAVAHPDPARMDFRLQELRKGSPAASPTLLDALGIDAERFRQAAARLDFAALAAAGAVTLRGIDGALPLLRSLEGLPRPAGLAAAPPLAPPPAAPCAGLLPVATVVVPGVLLLGFGGPEAYGAGAGTDVLLSIDLGGDDAYCNNAGSTQASGGDPLTGPTPCVPALPIGVLVDVGGDDAYHSTYGGPGGTNTDDTSAHSVECFEGAGALGIGMLVDLAGDDGYNSWKVLDDTGDGQCPLAPTAIGGPGDARLIDTSSQGFGGLGVGVLADLGGDDAYGSYNTLCSGNGVTTLHGIQTQGAGMAGIGIAADYGAGRNAWGSFNAQHNFAGLGNNHYTSFQQGAATLGVGVLLAKEGTDAYLTGNTADAPGAIGWSVWELSNSQGAGTLGGVGLLADPSGNDRYVCGTRHAARDSSVLLFVSHQGAGAFAGAGTLADLDGNDCYDSSNLGSSGGTSWMAVWRSQGAAFFGGAGLLVDLGGRQDFVSGNALLGSSPTLLLGPTLVPAATWLSVDVAQGAASGDGSVGIFVAANAGSGDRYLSGNAQASAAGADAASFTAAQGSAGSTTGTAVGVFLDVDTGGADSHASDNVANAGAGSADGIVLYALQGASNGGTGLLGPLMPPLGGTSIFVDAGGANRYAAGNAYAPFAPPFGCNPAAFPASAGASCIDWTNGASKGPPGVFADLSLPLAPALVPDSYFTGPYNGYGQGMYGVLPTGLCIDVHDTFAEVPVPGVGGTCLDA